MERRDTFTVEIEKMIKKVSDQKTIVTKMRKMQLIVQESETVEEAYNTYNKKYGECFLRVISISIPNVFQFKPFWSVGVGEKMLKNYLNHNHFNATLFLETAAIKQSEEFFAHLFSLAPAEVKKKIDILQVAEHQSARIFLDCWNRLSSNEKNKIALYQKDGDKNRLTLGNILLQNQPPEVFLTYWKDLGHKEKNKLFSDKQYRSANEKWSLLQVAILMLPKKDFLQWLADVQNSLKLTPSQWADLLIYRKDKQGCCALDIAASYRMDLLMDMIRRLKLDSFGDLKQLWIKQSPLIKSIEMKPGDSTGYSLKIFYRDVGTKDASGNSRLFREAFRGNKEALDIALACFPTNDSDTIADKMNDDMLSFVWKFLAMIDHFCSIGTFKNSLEYRKGALLRMAILGGQSDAVKIIVKRLPYDISSAFSLAINSKNRLGFERMKPIMDELLKVKSIQSWLTFKHQFHLSKLGYCVDFNSKTKYPEIKSLKGGLSTTHQRIETSNQHDSSNISLGDNAHILMKKPRMVSNEREEHSIHVDKRVTISMQ